MSQGNPGHLGVDLYSHAPGHSLITGDGSKMRTYAGTSDTSAAYVSTKGARTYMSQCGTVVGCLLIALLPSLLFPQTSVWKDPSPHQVRFVTVDKDVKLEVLDWGGSGTPIVLLAGGGDTAHVFDDFAPKLQSVTHLHVYAITRRGFGASSYEATNDPADRLGEDVLSVIESLKLDRPILAGHSIAGAEMSWIANNHADRVAGLVYLEAGYSYAFDDGHGASVMDMMALHAPQPPPPAPRDLADFGALDNYDKRVNGFRSPESELRQERQLTPTGAVGEYRNLPGGPLLMQLLTHPNRYSHIPVPSLFIFGNPHTLGTWVDHSTDAAVRDAAKAYSTALATLTERQEHAVKSGLPTAHVITISRANHYIYFSNEHEVLRDMRAFISTLH